MNRLKQTLLLFLISFFAIPNFAQKVDFDKVVTPPEMGTRNFKEYLVQLAWMNSPENTAVLEEKKLREYEYKYEKRDWMKDIQFSINLNENNLSKRDTILIVPGQPDNSNVNLFPIFNLNASVSLGTFTNRKNKLGIAEQRVKIAEADVNQKKLQVRAEVLKRYQEYEMQQEVLKANTQAEEDASQAYILITDLFKVDKATFEDYNAASSTYHTAVEKRIRANADMSIAKFKVEEMIGIALDEATRMRK